MLADGVDVPRLRRQQTDEEPLHLRPRGHEIRRRRHAAVEPRRQGLDRRERRFQVRSNRPLVRAAGGLAQGVPDGAGNPTLS